MSTPHGSPSSSPVAPSASSLLHAPSSTSNNRSTTAPPPASQPSAAPPAAPPPASVLVAPPPPPPPSAPPPSSAPPPPSTPPPAESASPPTAPPPPASTSESSPPPASTPASTPPPPQTASPPPPPPTSATHPSTSNYSPPPPTTPIKAPPPPPPPPATPKASSTTSHSSVSSSSPTISAATLVGIAVAGTIAISVILFLLFCLCKRKKRKQFYPGGYYGPPGVPSGHFKDSYYGPDAKQQWGPPSPAGADAMIHMPTLPSPRNGYGPIPPAPTAGPPSMGGSKSWFTYEELATATGGFARSNLLGEGGFGCVYKGVLPEGKLVAVKQLKVGGGQGEKEFRAEVEIISRVHHRHLVSLVGYCIVDSQRLLVYEYVPNGTLEYHLYGKGRPAMDWPTRVKIATGAARGLAYLHEDCHPRIIHRDIKSSNILLDDNFDAQVSDFGLAKLTLDANTHVTTRVMGTFGYMAPEYASSGKLTEKSDVFSFGVVLLELMTGRKPVDQTQPLGEESLVEWARPLLTQTNSEEDLQLLVDPSLNGAYDHKEMLRMVEAAAACIRHSATKRPRMGQVVRALEGDIARSDLNNGIKPGHSHAFGSLTNTEYSNYSADMKRFRRVALESREYGSEYSEGTSDYGMNRSASSGEYQMSREVNRNFGRSQLSRPISSSNEYSTSQEMEGQGC